MNDLIFCLNVTIPVFLTMILGMIFRYLHIFTDEFVKRMNAFVFGLIMIAFCVIYIIIASILVYRYASKTFRLRQ